MIRFFQFVILTLGLAFVALTSAIVTMRFAIHGAEVKVPDLHGLTSQEALARAAELGVEMSIDNRFYSAEIPAGRILSQSPAPGTVVRREWHLRAIESLGPQTIAIPNLVGMPQRAATIQIRRLNLELGAVAEMPSDSTPPGTVIAQDPSAGAAGVERPSVAMLISDNTPPPAAGFVMPDVTGRSYSAAVSIFTHAGLKVAPPVETSAAASQALPETVINQTPEAGSRVDPATTIQLTVAH